MSLKQRVNSALKERLKENTLRSRIVVENRTSRFLILSGKKYYNFSSNDYLGLSRHPAIIHAWKDGAEQYGVGSGGSSHVSGYTRLHYQFEEELADWLGYQRALLFISGFSANQAVIIALMKKNDYIFADRLSHASLLEAANLSPANLRRFFHNNVQNLEFLLKKANIEKFLVVTEGIFSMDGDSAPLSAIHTITKRKSGWLMVDDAHGFGIIGKEGKGSCSNQMIKPELLVVTFSKSAGVSGAAVLCSEDIANYLIQYAYHLIYSTSMPPAQVAALLASLNIIRSNEGEERRQKLAQRIRQFRDGVSTISMNLLESNSAIQPIIVGDNARALELTQYLRKKNIWTVAIRPPAVPKNTARIRLTFSSFHKEKDILILLEALHDSDK